jgi:hypothetical protein
MRWLRFDSLNWLAEANRLAAKQMGYLDPEKNCRVAFVTPTFWQSERGHGNTANSLPT